MNTKTTGRKPTRFSVTRLTLTGALLTLAGCASTPPTTQSCGCQNYLPQQTRPAWVDGETANTALYQTQGIASCTGIKTMDYAEAEKNARDNLGRMINVQVSSDVLSVSKDNNGASTRFGQVSSHQVSKVLLSNSQIFAYWVDPSSCTVYAGARVAKTDIDNALKQKQAEENAKLNKQQWRVSSEGKHAEAIASHLSHALSQQGITLSKHKQNFSLSASITEQQVQNNGQTVRITLALNAKDPAGAVIWNRIVTGKGFSYTPEKLNNLVSKAVQDALDNSQEELNKFMQGSSKP